MKIEIGMYVRTKNGIIDKIIDIEFNDNYNTEPSRILLEKNKGYIEHKNHNVKKENNILIIDDDTITYWFSATEILKSSYSLIDLIGVGDYVNGYKVVQIGKSIENRKYITTEAYHKINYGNVFEKEIETILTKEQFEKEAYKI